MGDVRVTVVTATIGHPLLARALRSVVAQTYGAVEHVLVVDGPQFEDDVRDALEDCSDLTTKPSLLVLPKRTGRDGWCSHRIYAAVPFLVDSDYVCFLDQDNWFDPGHIESLVAAMGRTTCGAAHALRSIYDQSAAFVCHDDCQSLGLFEGSYDRPAERHIDTNCWLLATTLARRLANEWLTPFTGDRVFAAKVMETCPSLVCTGLYTVNYTAGSRWESASVDYFLHGNEVMRQRHPGGFPWAAAPVLQV